MDDRESSSYSPSRAFDNAEANSPVETATIPLPDNQHKEGEYFAADSHRSHITVAHGAVRPLKV